ncbi:MAG: arylamine N-acetyltransferase [Betaproteobacteria bacterium]|nr:arylamine N-acetyltransferase [Betaproteobacteria bacterium]
MNIESYLKRIGYAGRVEATHEALTSLHLAHMQTIPFENIDIPLRVPITLDFEKIFEKIVGRNRGGFCYELNGLFGWLLNEIGFEVEMLSARVFRGDGQLSPEFSHMLLRVNKDHIADVGFGDSFTRPLMFDEIEQKQETGGYRLTQEGGTWQMERRLDGSWMPQYLFTVERRGFDEFEEMCRFQQTSPESVFTRKVVCSKATPAGRLTFANGRFITTNTGLKTESGIESAAELKSLLFTHFGFELDDGYDRLLQIKESAA